MNLKGSKTEQNLWHAFAGESQARNKYDYFASQAKKEGFEQISEIFSETAANEKEHAKVLFKLLMNNSIPKTEENLLASAQGENEEYTNMYPEFAGVAREEGFYKIADIFDEIAKVEEAHEKRFKKLLSNVNNKTVFKKNVPVKWKCRNCGYIHEGTEAPKVCPACAHPQSYYEVMEENY